MNLNKSNFSLFDFSQESWTRLLSVLFIPVWEHAKERASLLTAVLLGCWLSDVNIHLRVPFSPCVSGLFAVVGLETFSLLRSSTTLLLKEALSPVSVLLFETECSGHTNFWKLPEFDETAPNRFKGKSAFSLINYRRRVCFDLAAKERCCEWGKEKQTKCSLSIFFLSESCDSLKKQPSFCGSYKTHSICHPATRQSSSSFTQGSTVLKCGEVWSAGVRVSDVIFRLHLHSPLKAFRLFSLPQWQKLIPFMSCSLCQGKHLRGIIRL